MSPANAAWVCKMIDAPIEADSRRYVDDDCENQYRSYVAATQQVGGQDAACYYAMWFQTYSYTQDKAALRPGFSSCGGNDNNCGIDKYQNGTCNVVANPDIAKGYNCTTNNKIGLRVWADHGSVKCVCPAAPACGTKECGFTSNSCGNTRNCGVGGTRNCPAGQTCNASDQCNPTCTAPAIPGGRSATGSCNASNLPRITLNWAAVTGANSYNVRYIRSGITTWTTATGVSSGQNYTSGIAESQTYQWEVQAAKSCGQSSAWSATGTVSTPSCTSPPPAPNPTATSICTASTVSQIVINWPAIAGATDYQVRYRRNSEAATVATWATPATTPSTSYSISGLPVSTAYVYGVASRNSSGTTWSTNRNITTASGALCTVTTYSVTGNVWSDNNNNSTKNAADPNVAGILIEARQGASAIGSGTSNSSGNYTIAPALSAGTYILRVTPVSTYSFGDIRDAANTTVISPSNNYSFTVGPNRVYNARLIPVPVTYSITGNVFVDTDQNGSINGSEVNYSGAVTVTARHNATGTTYTSNSAGYSLANLPSGTYTVTYAAPTGYRFTHPSGNSYPGVTLPCNTQADTGDNVATCTATNGVQNLNFGINNTSSWIQAEDGGIRIDSGYNYDLPGANPTCSDGQYASTGTSPGVVYSGAGTSDFGPNGGQASAPPLNWNVDSQSGGASFTPVIPRTIRTSYQYVLANVRQAKVAERDIAPYCTGGLGNCSLSANLPSGAYVVNGNLSFTAENNPFTQGNYIILVSGNITIRSNVSLSSNSTAIFSAGGNITADSSVGTLTHTSTTPHLQGIYSAGNDFIIAGNNNCSVGDDRRLNIEGSVIANASLSGGQIVLQRLLCSTNNQCPALSVKISPRLLLLSPGILKVPSYIWKEVAP